jgi:hypothetical protein
MSLRQVRAVSALVRGLAGIGSASPGGSSSPATHARMRKRDRPEAQRGRSPLAIGLGPNFVAGGAIDIVVETGWEQTPRLGRRLGRT